MININKKRDFVKKNLTFKLFLPKSATKINNMPETPTFREKCIEVCKQKINNRAEAIAMIERTLAQINQVQSVKFNRPRDVLKQDALRSLLARLNGEDLNAAPVKTDWTQNPRHVISVFLQDIIKIFKSTAAQLLWKTIEKCIDHYKKEYPNLSGNISISAEKVNSLAAGIVFLETIEEQNTILIFITSVIGNTKKSVQESLNQ